MTFSQILELITSVIGSIQFSGAGNPLTQAAGTTGLLKGFAYALAVVSPTSTSFSPLIFFCVVISLIGLGIGLIKRILKL